MTLLVGLLCVCALGLAQGNFHYADAPKGVICVYQTSSGEWIADGFPPNVDPHKIAKVNPVYLIPIDGSGPGPHKRRYINPNYLISQD